MTLLAIAALIWIGVHLGIAGSAIRRSLAGRIGEQGFRTAFSIISVAAISLLITAYTRAPYRPLWTAPPALIWVLVALMLLAFLLFAAAVLARNPTAIGGEAALHAEPKGIVRITRHPMLWSFALWAAIHATANGDVASLLFFGAFLITSLAGMPSIDAKVQARDPQAWRGFASRTSILPFGAVLAKRNTVHWREIGVVPLLLGLALWVALLVAHPWLFGVKALPT